MLSYYDNIYLFFSMSLKLEIADTLEKIKKNNTIADKIYSDSDLVFLLLEIIDNSRFIGSEPGFIRRYLGYVSTALGRIEKNLGNIPNNDSEENNFYLKYRQELGQYREALYDMLEKCKVNH